MSWIAHNGNLRFPPHPAYGWTVSSSLYEEYSLDTPLQKYNYMFLNKRVISPEFGYSYVVNGSVMKPVARWMNGFCYFFGSTGYILEYIPTYGWCIIIPGTLDAGMPPFEKWVYNGTDIYHGGYYIGDAFYTGTLPSLGGSSVFNARGGNRGTVQGAFSGTPVTVTTKWDYWQRDSETEPVCGIYKFKGVTTQDDKILGLPRFVDNLGQTYTRSLDRLPYPVSRYTYESIKYDTAVSKWILGTYNDSAGWLEGDEPNINNPVTFTFCKPAESEITGENKTITFDKYVLGNNTKSSYGFNVSRWGKYDY